MRFWQRPAVARSLKWFAVVSGLAVPVITLPQLPDVSLWPALIGLLPWTVGKYVLCPLRWHGLSASGRRRRWHLAAYAESELLGLLTPGHVGADLWRIKRLHDIGMPRGSAAAEVALDRLVGALGLAAFVGLAGAALPVRQLMVALGLAALLVVAVLLVRRVRPHWIPRREWPPPRRLVGGLALSIGYQASIIALLLGALAANGHAITPLVVVGAFGASQLAGAVPGPNGASPRDVALVVALAALGVPWTAAIGAVALKALLAWAPGLLLGGGCLLLARRWNRAGSGAFPGTYGASVTL
jgi:hypothetical protein